MMAASLNKLCSFGSKAVRTQKMRLFSTTCARSWGQVPEWASQEAREALEGFQNRFTSGRDRGNAEPVSRLTQVIDANQIQLLRITQAGMLPLGAASSPLLDERQNSAASNDDRVYDVKYEESMQQREEEVLTGQKAMQTGVLQNGIAQGSSIVPTEHLCFFTPRVASSTLGRDGSDTSFNPPGGVFTRRMWAGGEMTWPSTLSNDDLRVGDIAWEQTYVEDAQLKRIGKSGAEMIVVWVRKEIGRTGSDVPLIIDRRSWVFQRALDESRQSSSSSSSPSSSSDLQSLSPPSELLRPTLQCQSHANLFRYSALTFNAHAIHLSPQWAQNVEGHSNIVVHGPLNLSLLVRKWGREYAGWHLDDYATFNAQGVQKASTQQRRLLNVSYRAKRPVYADQPYWLGFVRDSELDKAKQNHTDDKQDRHHVVAMHADGQVAVQATITSLRH